VKKTVYFSITFLILILDQASKFIIRNYVDFGPSNYIKITKKFFWLTHVQNEGAAFSLSLGSDLVNRIVFVIISLLASGLLVRLILTSKSKVETLSFSLILGGALGNLIDRIFLGSVTDFIWWDFPDFIMHRWPVFNIADSAIVVAITIMIVFYLFFGGTKSLEEK